MIVNKFWMVIRESGNSAPTMRHETKDAAIAEANRLSLQANERYYVLETVGYLEQPRQPVNYTPMI